MVIEDWEKFWADDEAWPKIYKRQLTDAEKELIIAEALSTEEGRRALAEAMVEPIRNAMRYGPQKKKRKRTAASAVA